MHDLQKLHIITQHIGWNNWEKLYDRWARQQRSFAIMRTPRFVGPLKEQVIRPPLPVRWQKLSKGINELNKLEQLAHETLLRGDKLEEEYQRRYGR